MTRRKRTARRKAVHELEVERTTKILEAKEAKRKQKKTKEPELKARKATRDITMSGKTKDLPLPTTQAIPEKPKMVTLDKAIAKVRKNISNQDVSMTIVKPGQTKGIQKKSTKKRTQKSC